MVTESSGMRLIEKLADTDLQVLAFDPLAVDAARAVLGDRVTYLHSAETCLEQADVCVLVNPEPISCQAIENYRHRKSIVVIDCWRKLRPEVLNTSVKWIGISAYTEGVVPELAAISHDA